MSRSRKLVAETSSGSPSSVQALTHPGGSGLAPATVEHPNLAFEAWVTFRGRYHYVSAAVLLVALGALPLATILLLLTWGFAKWFFLGAIATVLVAALERARERSARFLPIVVDDRFVRVGEQSLERSELRGLVVPRNNGSVDVELSAPSAPRVSIQCASVDEASGLLQKLNLATSSRTALLPGYEYRPLLVFGIRVVRVISLFSTLLLFNYASVPVGLLFLLTFFATRYLRQGTIEIGADGILLSRPHGKHFVPWLDIDALVIDDEKIVLELVSGKKLALQATDDVHIDRSDNRNAQAALNRHIEMAFKASDTSRPAEPGLERLLGRGGRALGDWRAFLQNLTHPDYRTAGVTKEDLERALVNPVAKPDVRVGAAIALAAAGPAKLDPEASERLRHVARAAASPDVRDALEHLAAGEEEAAILEHLIAHQKRKAI